MPVPARTSRCRSAGLVGSPVYAGGWTVIVIDRQPRQLLHFDPMPRHRVVVAALGSERERLSHIFSAGDHRVAGPLHRLRRNIAPAVAADCVFDCYIIGQRARRIDELQFQCLAGRKLRGNFAKFQMMLTRPLRAAERRGQPGQGRADCAWIDCQAKRHSSDRNCKRQWPPCAAGRAR